MKFRIPFFSRRPEPERPRIKHTGWNERDMNIVANNLPRFMSTIAALNQPHLAEARNALSERVERLKTLNGKELEKEVYDLNETITRLKKQFALKIED